MEQPDKTFFSVIKNFVLREENQLKLMGKGVFHMPEMAMVYLIGKEIMIHRELIFETDKVEWIRAAKLANSGINDLAFHDQAKQEVFIFEFKMRGDRSMYKEDVDKLKGINENNLNIKGQAKIKMIHKYFCAVIGEKKKERSADPNDTDNSRKNFTDAEPGVVLIGSYLMEDQTKDEMYPNEIVYPNVCLWKV